MRILQRLKPPIPYKYIYIGALLFSMIVMIQALGTDEHGGIDIRTDTIVIFTVNYLLWAVLIDWVYGFSKRFRPERIYNGKWLGLIIFETLILIVVHLLVSNFMYYAFVFMTEDISWNEVLRSFRNIIPRATMSRVLDISVIVLILKIIDTFKTSQARKLELADMQSQLNEVKLRSLKEQLNPHFLFNALHAMYTIIGIDDEKAKSMVVKMSGLLRKMLDQQDSQEVTLDEELAYLDDYLAIEKERFHDRLTVEMDIATETRILLVPALLLQPLAENAFKHGISLVEGEGTISLSSKMMDDILIIEMSNTIPSEENRSVLNSTKLGLLNLRNRLLGLYGERQSSKVTKTNNLFTITISIKQEKV
jgi:sensor histidine kinase YesM